MIVGLVAASACGATAGASSLPDLVLPNLDRGAAPLALSSLRGHAVALVYFEPDCTWCLRQLQAFGEVSSEFGLTPVAVGIHGEARELRRWIDRVGPSYPRVIETPALSRALGEVPATPFTFLVDRNGDVRGTIRGYEEPTRLRARLKALFGANV